MTSIVTATVAPAALRVWLWTAQVILFLAFATAGYLKVSRPITPLSRMMSCKGSTFREITLKRLRALRIPLPPVAEQDRIVRVIDDLERGLQPIRDLQARTGAALHAFLPSILNGASSGDL